MTMTFENGTFNIYNKENKLVYVVTSFADAKQIIDESK